MLVNVSCSPHEEGLDPAVESAPLRGSVVTGAELVERFPRPLWIEEQLATEFGDPVEEGFALEGKVCAGGGFVAF